MAAKQWLHYKEGDHYNYDVGQSGCCNTAFSVCVYTHCKCLTSCIIFTNPTATS